MQKKKIYGINYLRTLATEKKSKNHLEKFPTQTLHTSHTSDDFLIYFLIVFTRNFRIKKKKKLKLEFSAQLTVEKIDINGSEISTRRNFDAREKKIGLKKSLNRFM